LLFTESGELHINLEDDIVAGCLLTTEGNLIKG
jgi:hypothetical protein